MESCRVLLVLDDASAAASLATWLRRQGGEVSFVVPDESMGGGEILSCTLVGMAGLRALVAIAQEWIRAHRTKISVKIEGHGSFVVEGTTDIDQVIRLLEVGAPEGAGDV